MKKLFIFLLVLVVIIVLPIVILYFTLSDSIDEAPVDLYKEDVTFDGEIAKLIDSSLENKNDAMYMAVSEDDLNLLVFALIREKINTQYYREGCTSDECRSIMSQKLPDNIMLVGGKTVRIKHAYFTLENNTMAFKITLDALGFKTSVNAELSFEKTDSEYKLTFTKLRIGKLNLLSGLGKTLLNSILPSMGITESDMNKEFEEKDIPLTFHLEDFSFTFSKSGIGDYLSQSISDDEDQDQQLMKDFLGILTSEENDLIDVGFFDVDDVSHFGVKLDLSEIKYDSETDGIPPYQFNYEEYNEKMSLLSDDELVKEHYELVGKYLMRGYEEFSSEDRSIIDEIDFSEVGIADTAAFTGLMLQFDINLEDEITDTIYDELADISDADIVLDIDEVLLNKVLYSSGFVGTGFSQSYEIQGEQKTVSLGIEAVWIDVVEDQLGFKLLFNLNGIQICLFTSFVNTTPNTAKIEADFDELRMGTIEFPDTMKQTILDLLNTAFTDSGMEIIAITDNKIVIDSNEFIDEMRGDDSFTDLLDIIEEEGLLILDLSGAAITDNGKIEFLVNLEPLELKEDMTEELTAIAVPFDSELFVQNKTQTFIISNLSGGEQKIIFTEREFERFIYTDTNGYEAFSNTTLLPDQATSFTFSVDGILLDLHPTTVTMKFLVTINGLKSIIEIQGTAAASPTEDEVVITLADTLKIGTAETDSEFLFSMLDGNLDDFGIMDYDATNHSFTLSSISFQEMMEVGGTGTPLTVDKIRLVEGAIEVIVIYEDPLLETMIDTVSDTFEDVLADDFLDTTEFDTTDPNQDQAVENLNEVLDDISETLNGSGELTDEQTNALIESINGLSEENQQEFLEQLEQEANITELLDLYDDLFGN